jgi:diguanylate cyclase (GGDEF)-like protein
MRVLIADDELTSRLTLRGLLKPHDCEIIEAETGNQALDIIQSDTPPDFILLDWNMPGLTGVEVATLLRETHTEDYQPYVIIISAYEQEQKIIEALSYGADDYITKPIDGHFLSAKYAVARRIIETQEKLKYSNRVLEKLAYYDELTGVLNRRAGQASFMVEVERMMRRDQNIALAITDIDYFKKVNDDYGHQAGDRVLQHFADTLSKTLRPYDIVSRYGGEEFMLITEIENAEKARILFDRVRQAVAEQTVRIGRVELTITASIGVHVLTPSSELAIEPVVAKADEALYQAKAEGRNRVVVSSDISEQVTGESGII